MLTTTLLVDVINDGHRESAERHGNVGVRMFSLRIYCRRGNTRSRTWGSGGRERERERA